LRLSAFARNFLSKEIEKSVSFFYAILSIFNCHAGLLQRISTFVFVDPETQPKADAPLAQSSR